MEVVDAGQALGRHCDCGDGRQQQRRQNANDAQHHKQLDEGESGCRVREAAAKRRLTRMFSTFCSRGSGEGRSEAGADPSGPGVDRFHH